jgi:pilus assembly protein Flp/PilA
MPQCSYHPKGLKTNNKGATAIEYALIAGLLSIVIILAVYFVGGQLNQIFSGVGSDISSANN